MESIVFVDTSAWVASFVEKDENHPAAAQILPERLRANCKLLTTDYVLDETITRIRYQGGHTEAVSAGEALLESGSIILVEIDARLRQEAWILFKRYDDQELSFTDCTSAAVLRKFGLAEIFSFDSDFRRIGFRVLPRLSRH